MVEKKVNFIDQEINNKVIIVYGKMGQWKTLFAVLASFIDFEKRIYSNVDIYKNDKIINKSITDKKNIENIRFSFEPWLIVIDEWWIVMNSRRSMSDINVFLSETIKLSRKVNCSMLFIAQSFENLDIDTRRLCDLILEMKKVRTPNWPIFYIQVKKQVKNRLVTVKKIKIQLITDLKKRKLKYNTLESSKIKFDK